MKLISNFCAGMTLLLVLGSWTYIQPILMNNGTAVIYAMTKDGKNGSKPYTMLLPESLTTKQFNLLNFAYSVAKDDNHKNPQYLQGIIMQESGAGEVKDYRVAGLSNKPGDRYFGIGQVKLAAAKAVMTRYPEMWKFLDTKTDEELQARLILDDEFNIRVASKYAIIVGVNENATRGIGAYNRGPAGINDVDADELQYTKKVKSLGQRVKNILGENGKLQSTVSPPVQIANFDPSRRSRSLN